MDQKALFIVDVQNDFCPGGALAVSGGDKVVPVLNRYIYFFTKQKCPIFASRDWHPGRSKHFKSHGGLWPEHCVQETKGALFHPDLKLPKGAIILSKGTSEDSDGYSGFDSMDATGQGPLKILHDSNVKILFVGGLATDYCVKFTVLDALKHGFKVNLLMDAVKGVNLKPTDSQKAIDEMAAAGAQKIVYTDLTK